MSWNALSFRIGTLISGALLFTFQAAGGPPGFGRGVAPVAPLSPAPTPRGGGYVNWHAASNLGMHPASWNIGPAWNLGPTHVRAPGSSNWGYHQGSNNWGYHQGWGNGYGHGGARSGVIVPFYPSYPVFPFYDTGGYGYSDNSEQAPPPPDGGQDYGISEGAAPYARPPYEPTAPPPGYQPSAPPMPYQPPAPPQSEYHQQAAAPPAQPEPVVVQPPITVVLQSGQQIVIQNYAVMDAMLWDFSKPVARKIPLSTIDVSASAIATYAAGGEFPQLTPAAQ